MTADAKPAGPSAFISPVTRPVPLRQSVYEALVELVVGGRLSPGEHLVETELARLLGVSRQPVREALHRLEAEGWVDLRPNQGAFVHVPTDHEVDELLDVRELLEVQTARLAARSASPAAVARLRVLWHRARAPSPPATPRAWWRPTTGSTPSWPGWPGMPCWPTWPASSAAGCAGTTARSRRCAATNPGPSTVSSSTRWPPVTRGGRPRWPGSTTERTRSAYHQPPAPRMTGARGSREAGSGQADDADGVGCIGVCRRCRSARSRPGRTG